MEKSAPLESKLEHVELGKVIPNLARTPELDFVGRATERVAREGEQENSGPQMISRLIVLFVFPFILVSDLRSQLYSF